MAGFGAEGVGLNRFLGLGPFLFVFVCFFQVLRLYCVE